MQPKRAREEEEVQTNGTVEDITEEGYELYRVRKKNKRTRDERETWRRLFENCNKKQEQELERLWKKQKEKSKRLRKGERTILRETSPIENRSLSS